jgi:NAD(P)-dependent dehydrogenase (short-subunit alcohol dehydrogenase family)
MWRSLSMRRFEGRVAFVTGAAHGIGAATSRWLCAEGATVVIADKDREAADAIAAELGENAWAVSCDITRRASVDEAIAAAVDRCGALHVLVNVAGGSRVHPPLLDGMEDRDWTDLVDLNLTGAMRCIRAAAPHLHTGGAIVLVSSVNGLSAFGDEAYSSAKAGLSVLAKNLAVRLGPAGIRVNVVAPGTIRTRVWIGQGGADRLAGLYPLGRVGEPEEVAAAIAFLASDDASWITGSTLPVDGGVLAGPLGAFERLRGD